ncbi:MAG: hypothetical protein HN356_04665 [Calditrichaeota bacterium]|nr:hypothetical protein [Calditrichota bacterium]
MKKFICFLLISAVLTTALPSFAIDRYERKSISYINSLWVATPEAKNVELGQIDYMLETVKENIEMERFDYNPLPESLLRNFINAANADSKLSVKEIAELMEAELAPVIIEILEQAVPERGKELVSEEMERRASVIKQKTSGITVEEIVKVMNAAYIYLPVLTGYKEKAKDNDNYSYTIKGGIIWFHVGFRDDVPFVELKVAKTTRSMGFGSKKHAYKSAVRNFARNLKVATQDVPEFKLQAQIAEVDGSDITFKLGKKEGIRVDDCFYIGEWMQDSRAKVTFEKTGWVRIASVADNRENKIAISSAYTVKRGDLGVGMTVVEHPRLGIDIAVKPGLFATKVSDGSILFPYDTKESESMAFGMDIDAQYNLAPGTGIRQLFFLIGGHISLPSVEFDETYYDSPQPFIWGFHGGFFKRMYLSSQHSLTFEAIGGLRYFSISTTVTDGFTDETYILSNNTGGGQISLGYDYATSANINFGFTAGMKFYGKSDIWTATDSDGNDYPFDHPVYPFPEIDLSGVTFGIYLHYSPPSLAFDPIDMVKGMMGS